MKNNNDEISQMFDQSNEGKQKIKPRDLNLNLYTVDIEENKVIEFNNYENHYVTLDEDILKENFQINEELTYDKILPELFPWKNNVKENLAIEQLPIKLYNIRTKKVEEMTNLSKVKSYATLSYIWGDRDENGYLEKVKVEEREITISANKALDKAIKTLGLINVDKNKELLKESPDLSNDELIASDIIHLWIDQLCVNQGDLGEKSREVPKMSKYYSNSSVTLIAMGISIKDEIVKGLENAFISDKSDIINYHPNPSELDYSTNKLIEEVFAPIFKTIFRSRWFSRSWTFQEGWLSKQTIFMFDNCLVDGRFLATILTMKNRLLAYHGCIAYPYPDDYSVSLKSLIVENIKSFSGQKIATHIGWTYNAEGYNVEDRLTLNLGSALFGIKNRERTEAMDGLYSILGLLPYGNSVLVDYKIQPYEALRNIMKTALEQSYGEPLAWYGESSNLPNLSWMPKIYEDGSTSVQGGETIIYKPNKEILVTEEGLKIIGKEFNIIPCTLSLSGGSVGCPIEWSGKVEIICEGYNGTSLLSMSRYGEGIKIMGDTILIPNNDWSEGAIWVKKGKGNIRHRIGEVNFSISRDTLKIALEKEFIIGSVIEENSEEYTSLIEQLEIKH